MALQLVQAKESGTLQEHLKREGGEAKAWLPYPIWFCILVGTCVLRAATELEHRQPCFDPSTDGQGQMGTKG
jgi:hypothetical protein